MLPELISIDFATDGLEGLERKLYNIVAAFEVHTLFGFQELLEALNILSLCPLYVVRRIRKGDRAYVRQIGIRLVEKISDELGPRLRMRKQIEGWFYL